MSLEQIEGAAAADKPAVELPADAANWLALLRQCERDIKDLEETKKLARARLEQMLGEAEVGTLDGQPAVRFTYVHSNRFDTSTFKASRPDLYREFLVEGVSRRFTLADPQ